MRLFLERCVLTLVNIFCSSPHHPFHFPSLTLAKSPEVPPLSVMLVAGVGWDALINTLWFICGVIPGHIHGFYVTWTYFSRRKKVRKGRYPGGPKPFIYSKRVINGDASDERVRQLWAAEQRVKEEALMRKQSSRRRTGLGGSRTSPRLESGARSPGSQRKPNRWEV